MNYSKIFIEEEVIDAQLVAKLLCVDFETDVKTALISHIKIRFHAADIEEEKIGRKLFRMPVIGKTGLQPRE